jgi:hypothetical protein
MLETAAVVAGIGTTVAVLTTTPSADEAATDVAGVAITAETTDEIAPVASDPAVTVTVRAAAVTVTVAGAPAQVHSSPEDPDPVRPDEPEPDEPEPDDPEPDEPDEPEPDPVEPVVVPDEAPADATALALADGRAETVT